MQFKIKYDFTKYQPRTWSDQLKSDFGNDNEGVLVNAPNAKAALDVFNSTRLIGQQYNGFYLSIKPWE